MYKRQKQKGLKVYGYDLCESNIKVALNEKIIHEGLESLDQISEEPLSNDIDLILISVPPKQTLDVLNDISDIWNTEITITETCSVKNHIQLDNVSNIILSHPIAGSDKSGPSAADANLFLNKNNFVTRINNYPWHQVNKDLVISVYDEIREDGS